MFKLFSSFLLITLSFGVFADIFVAKKALERGDYQEAKSHLYSVAQIGNDEAQYALGLLYYQGKLGEVDKSAGFAWMFVASAYQHPKASEFASQIFQELNADKQKVAKALAVELVHKYGPESLLEKIYPYLEEKKVPEQTITQVAKETGREEILSDDIALLDVKARANNARVDKIQELISRLNEGYRHNAFDNLEKLRVEDESGLVIIKHDVNKLGEVVDPQVIFSWPLSRFDEIMVEYTAKSQFSPAKRGKEAVEQFGLIDIRRVGQTGPNSFRTAYPQEYRVFLNLKKQALEEGDLSAKYQLANILRAYGDIIAAEQPITYQELLSELASKGFVLAQFDYAQYLIYQEKDIDMGLGWLVKAVKAGYLEAELRMADLLSKPSSEYLVQDLEKAKFWFERVAEKGDERAKSKLRTLYSEQ